MVDLNRLYHPLGSKLIYLQYEDAFVAQPYEPWSEFIYGNFVSWAKSRSLGSDAETKMLWSSFREHTSNHQPNKAFDSISRFIYEAILLRLKVDRSRDSFTVINDGSELFGRTVDALLLLGKNFNKTLAIEFKQLDAPEHFCWKITQNVGLMERYIKAESGELLSRGKEPIFFRASDLRHISVSDLIYVDINYSLEKIYGHPGVKSFALRLALPQSLKKLDSEFHK